MNRDRGSRFVVIANALAALTALWFVIKASDGIFRGPARTDDLPYGDLLTLNRTGAAVWMIVALVAIAGAFAATFAGRRGAHLAGAALWAALAVIGFVAVVTESDTLGMSRPGDIAVALGLAVTGVVASLPEVSTSS